MKRIWNRSRSELALTGGVSRRPELEFPFRSVWFTGITRQPGRE
jgi:hypothetical protein